MLTPETEDSVGDLAVGLSIQDEAMGVARSAPQGIHYHGGVIYLLP